MSGPCPRRIRQGHGAEDPSRTALPWRPHPGAYYQSYNRHLKELVKLRLPWHRLIHRSVIALTGVAFG
jgi:hypothetical protein